MTKQSLKRGYLHRGDRGERSRKGTTKVIARRCFRRQVNRGKFD